MKKSLNSNAFGIALATVCFTVHAVLWILSIIAPRSVFSLIFNAQFFGADVASKYSLSQNISEFLLSLIVFVISGYIVGSLWAFVYNRFTK